MKIFLDWPDKHLSPNARLHWAAKAKYKAVARLDGFVCAKEAIEEYGVLDPGKNYRMDLTFCPPDKRRRDLDNIEASMKASFDGMCEALGIDDAHIKETIKRWGKVFKRGVVIVEIEEVNPDK